MSLFCAVDLDSFELKSWAQVCLWTVGFSRMAETLNAGRDPHTELGADLANVSVEEAYVLVKDKTSDFKDVHRQTGKVGNFGLPGGMGAATFRTQARKEYRVFMDLARAQEVKRKWGTRWEESGPYFAYINKLLTGERGKQRGAFKHFVSQRIRGDMPYTVACNSPFQGLAADAAKSAGFQLAKEMYCDKSSPIFGCRIVNFPHDEFIAEVPSHPERAHIAAYRITDVMVAEVQRWIPDVKITASPCLMRQWAKKAEPRFDNGLLVPWVP